MFKKILISLIFVMVSMAPVTVVAGGDAASVLNVENRTNNDVTLLKVADKAGNATSQPQSLSVDKSESVLSTEWLFAIALFWFVMLSNRRGI